MRLFTGAFFSPRLVGTRQRHARVWNALVLLTLLVLGGGLIAGRAQAELLPAVKDADAPIVAKCKADLAQRFQLKVDDIQVVEMQAVTWPDAALGMPEIGKMYAQVLTPGWTIILQARNSLYLYTASEQTYRFGGPVALWSFSMLYLQPAPNEPNLNGDLYQCSLLGTNGVRLVSGVSAYYPQADGVVLCTRRTSRSAHDLLLVNARHAGETRTLYAALAFGEAALNSAQDAWAAYVRPRVGARWQVVVAPIGQDDATPRTLSLPDGVQPGRMAWEGEKLLLLASKGRQTVCYQTIPTEPKPVWTIVPASSFPGARSYALNKSESLEVAQVTANGQPGVEVARVWFTGDRKVLATIGGLTLRGHDLLTLREYDFQPGRYLFVWGAQGAQSAAYTVDIVTGEVTPGFTGLAQDIKLFACAPAAPPYRLVMKDF